MGQFSVQYTPTFAIDQSGLAAPYTSGVTDFDSFASTTGTVNGGSSFTTWYSAQNVLTGNFDFDLGGTRNIESFALWADPQVSPNQGVKDFELYADDNAAYSSPVLLGVYTAVDGIPNATNFGQVFTFTNTAASHVRMVILSNHGSTFVTGMVEAAFEVGVPPACEADQGGDGTVGVPDLLAIINDWGPCAGCPSDIAPPGGDGTVGVPDLLAVINDWGPCD